MRMDSMVDSAPDATKRTLSAQGIRLWTRSPHSSMDSTGPPKWEPRGAALANASTTAGWAWPSRSEADPSPKSMYSLPSTSHFRGPWPRAMLMGKGEAT